MSSRTLWPKRFRHRLVMCSAVVFLVTPLGILYSFEHCREARQLENIRHQARLLFKQIPLTRKWISDHGGVFVEKLPWITANPFLDEPTLDARGKRYVKENPAMVTRELARCARDQGGRSGLGLTIGKGSIEGHGGSIGVQSDGQKESTFHFKLPFFRRTAGERTA